MCGGGAAYLTPGSSQLNHAKHTSPPSNKSKSHGTDAFVARGNFVSTVRMSSTVTLEKTTAIQSDGGRAGVVGSPNKTNRSPLLVAKKGAEGGAKEKARCCGRRCELVSYDKLPEFLKHNEFIVDHYRSEWPVKEALLSAFSIHNETINVWT